MDGAELLRVLELFGAGILIGAYGTIVGAGGGFVCVPLLIIVYGTSAQQAIGTSLAVILMNAVSGTAAYVRAKRVDYRAGWKFALATLPGALGGAFASKAFSDKTFQVVFGALLLALALFLIFGPSTTRTRTPGTSAGWIEHTIVDARGESFRYRYYEPGAIGASAVVGFFSSEFGIGGGIIHVPLLVHVFNFPAHIATATSHFILAITAAVGASVHFALGHVLMAFALPLGLGAVVGAQIGGRIAHRIHSRWLLRLLAVALIAVGARLMLQT